MGLSKTSKRLLIISFKITVLIAHMILAYKSNPTFDRIKQEIGKHFMFPHYVPFIIWAIIPFCSEIWHLEKKMIFSKMLRELKESEDTNGTSTKNYRIHFVFGLFIFAEILRNFARRLDRLNFSGFLCVFYLASSCLVRFMGIRILSLRHKTSIRLPPRIFGRRESRRDGDLSRETEKL